MQATVNHPSAPQTFYHYVSIHKLGFNKLAINQATYSFLRNVWTHAQWMDETGKFLHDFTTVFAEIPPPRVDMFDIEKHGALPVLHHMLMLLQKGNRSALIQEQARLIRLWHPGFTRFFTVDKAGNRTECYTPNRSMNKFEKTEAWLEWAVLNHDLCVDALSAVNALRSK